MAESKRLHATRIKVLPKGSVHFQIVSKTAYEGTIIDEGKIESTHEEFESPLEILAGQKIPGIIAIKLKKIKSKILCCCTRGCFSKTKSQRYKKGFLASSTRVAFKPKSFSFDENNSLLSKSRSKNARAFSYSTSIKYTGSFCEN